MSKDKGHAPSSGQVTKEPEKASTSAIIEMLCKNRLSEFERVTKQLKVATELKKKTRLREFVKAQHWTFHFWMGRNKSFLQKKTSVEDTNRSPCIPPEPSLAKRRRQNRARVRLQIMDVLEWLGSPLSEISEILDGRPQWEDRQSWDSDSDSGSTLVDGGRFEPEIEVHVKSLERFNNILLQWTKMIGDEGPTVKGVGAVIQADRDVIIDEGLEARVPAKESACAIVESGRDRPADEESGAKGPSDINESNHGGRTRAGGQEFLDIAFKAGAKKFDGAEGQKIAANPAEESARARVSKLHNESPDRELGREKAAKEDACTVVETAHNKDLDKMLLEKAPAKEEPCTVVWRGPKVDMEKRPGAKSPAKESARVEAPTQWSQVNEDASTVVAGTHSESPDKVPRQKADAKKTMTQKFRSIIPRDSTKGRRPG